jgi:hypothetical protein
VVLHALQQVSWDAVEKVSIGAGPRKVRNGVPDEVHIAELKYTHAAVAADTSINQFLLVVCI